MLTHVMMMERFRLLLDENDWPQPDMTPAHTDEELRMRAPDGSRPENPVCCLAEYDRRFGTQYHNPNVEWYCSCKSELSTAAIVEEDKNMARPPRNKPSDNDQPEPSNDELAEQVEPIWPITSESDLGGNDESHSQSRLRALGELSRPGQRFSPIMAVSKFPYRHVRHDKSEAVADAFFNDGKFWNLEWDVYYLWGPFSISSKPILFVPTSQVLKLLKTINDHVPGCFVALPTNATEIGLVNKFGNHPKFRPRFLGFSDSRERYNELERRVPGESLPMTAEEEAVSPPSNKDLLAHKITLEQAHDATKARNRGNKAVKKVEQSSKKRQWVTDLKQAERFLGLRPARISKAPDDSFEPIDESWDDFLATQESKKHNRNPPRIDVRQPSPNPFDKSVVFISVDIECYEKDKARVTEIGISTLDSEDLYNIAPGENAVNWREYIRSRHFRIREHGHLKNGEYVNDASNMFGFGKSEWISIKDAPAQVASCFRPPYSAPFEEGLEKLSVEDAPQRTIVLVGHDLGNDIRYLTRLGYDVTNLSTLYPAHIDTASLYRALMHEWQPKSLGTLCNEFDIVPHNLHNGGNDARFTMEVMLGIVVKSAAERGSAELKKEIENRQEEKVKEAVEAAKVGAMREAEGWESDEEVTTGGGVKLPA